MAIESKQCTKCGAVKTLDRFHAHASNSDGLEGACKACRHGARKTGKREAPDERNARARSKYHKRRDWFWELKRNPCERCGGTFHPVAMQFDHLPGVEKKFEVNGQNITKRLDVVLAEIAKCQLLCANCHHIVTWERATGETA